MGAIIAPFPLLWILHWSGLSSLEQLKLLCESKDAVFTVKNLGHFWLTLVQLSAQCATAMHTHLHSC